MVNPRQLPISLCLTLTASDPFHRWPWQQLDCAATTRPTHKHFFRIHRSGPRGPAIGCANGSTPLALGPGRKKAMWPVVHNVTFGVCVRPQEMLCSSQTRSRKPTDGGGSRFPISMRFPPPRKPNPVRSGALGRAGGMGVAIVAGGGRGWSLGNQDLPWARHRRSLRVSGSRLERHTQHKQYLPAVQCPLAHQAWSPFPRDAALPAPTQVPVRYPGDSSPATKFEGHPGGIQGPHARGSTVHRAGTKGGQKEQRRQHAQDFG